MRIWLHIGPDHALSAPIQHRLVARRAALADVGVLVPTAPGRASHARLAMAASDPDHVDVLRHRRGRAEADRQARLREELSTGLRREIARHRPSALILSAPELGTTLDRPSEIIRLREMLSGLGDDIRVVAHVDDPARALLNDYARQIFEGRTAPLDRDLALVDAPDWWAAARATAPPTRPAEGVFAEIEAAPHWLDYTALVDLWGAGFGTDRVHLHNVTDDPATDLVAAFDLPPDAFADAEPPHTPTQRPSAAWISRMRGLNVLLRRLAEREGIVAPPPMRQAMATALRVDGAPDAPGALAAVSARFAAANRALAETHAGLDADALAPDPPLEGWREADPGHGFRASQYLLAFMARLERAGAPAPEPAADLPPAARALFADLHGSPFAPHDRLAPRDSQAPAFDPAPRSPDDGARRLIVGCMKDEAPYIVEWIAYHRAIGFDDFLIYTNDCGDGTDALLGRLDALGVVHHRSNDDWTGRSPQQHALNRALDEQVLRNAAWIAHIDVDEFINIRCGNGTLSDLFDHAPDATNIAMTWRLFGHDGVHEITDQPVIAQFEACAPTYCPKPHTAWGFKTLTRNIGAYAKLSCHRPTKLRGKARDRVRWVNGSGRDITGEAAERGWRNSRQSIGYDLVQLNHYAVRSADGFLVKRQRGRALHVDRVIGLGYWIRNDWSGARDRSIQRNLPRLQVEMDRLLADPELRALHLAGLDWHRRRAAELKTQPDFAALRDDALALRLTPTERAAYALALDMEN